MLKAIFSQHFQDIIPQFSGFYCYVYSSLLSLWYNCFSLWLILKLFLWFWCFAILLCCTYMQIRFILLRNEYEHLSLYQPWKILAIICLGIDSLSFSVVSSSRILIRLLLELFIPFTMFLNFHFFPLYLFFDAFWVIS